MFFDQPLNTLVEQATARPDALRGHYAALFADIEDRDGALHSLCHPSWDWVEAELARLDSLRATGRNLGLLGVPIGVKDTIAVSGLPTMAGTGTDVGKILGVPQSPAVTALQEAGAVVVAKQATHQFGSSAGPASTQSNRGPAYFAGGSTVGGAVAVAAGFTRLALGNDAGGSIRQPAALAGVAGLRPRKGLISDDGQINGSLFGQSTGLIARSAEDIAMILERCPSLLASPPDQVTSGRGRPVIGVPDVSWSNIAPAAEAALRAAAMRLSEMGYDVVPSPLWLAQEARDDFFLVMNFDNWVFHEPLMVEHAGMYTPAVYKVMQAGRSIERRGAAEAIHRLAGHRERLLASARAEGVDILLTPSVPWPDLQKHSGSPRELSAEGGRFTIISNIYDLDSLSVPVAKDRQGRVRSVMLHGLTVPLPHLLTCARELERSRPPAKS